MAVPGMAAPAADEAMRIGIRLRALRAELGLTIPALAAKAGLSAGLISQIERGQANPSMRTIQRLTMALGVNLWAFIGEAGGEVGNGAAAPANGGAEPRGAEMPPFVRRRAERPRVVVGKSRMVKELLSPRGERGLRFMMVTLPPGGTADEMLTGPGEKGGYVVSGRVALTVGERQADLAEGDSFQFDSRHPHSLANHSAQAATVIWIISILEPHL